MSCYGYGSNNHDKDIRDLSVQDLFGAADKIPVYSGTNYDDRAVSGQAVLNYINANLANPAAPVTQPVVATAGMSITLLPPNTGQSVRLLLTALGTLATITLVIPGVNSPAGPAVDRQEILVTCSQIVTALTMSAGGTTQLFGAPTAIAALVPFKLFFDAGSAAWWITT